MRAVELAATGRHLALEALAGAGKTTTLELIANALGKNGQYVAFNKAIVNHAQRHFPAHVACNTAHSLAHRAVGYRYQDRLNGPRLPPKGIAELLDCRPIEVGTVFARRMLPSYAVASLVRRGLRRYVKTTDGVPALHHMPWVRGVAPAQQKPVAEALLPYVQAAWKDVQSPTGSFPFTHDDYLKMWQLDAPLISADYILFDEAQDADPVMVAVVEAQSAQRIYVGDRYQAIYEWRGAINAMEEVRVDQRAWLTRSWRFGEAVATVANRLLAGLSCPKTLRGHPTRASRIEPIPTPSAILCRTNAGVLQQLLAVLAAGRRAAVTVRTEELVSFARAAQKLREGKATAHPDLACFRSWAEVVEYVKEEPEEAGELGVWVRLIEDYEPAQLIQSLACTVPEPQADVLISTAHKAKGRQWPTVRVANDFPTFRRDNRPLLHLAYVAATRAQEALDITAWKTHWKGLDGLADTASVTGPTVGAGRAAEQPAQPRAAAELGAALARLLKWFLRG